MRQSLRLITTAVIITTTLALGACAQQATIYGKPYNMTYKQHNHLLQLLHHHGVGIVELGQTLRLVLPSDSFYQGTSTQIITWRKYTLYNVASLIRSYQDAPIVVSGYTDDTYNKHEQHQRSLYTAQGVAAYLWNHGVSMQRIKVRAMGTQHSVSSNTTPKGAAQNRRMTITIGLGSALSKPYNTYQAK